MKTVKKSIAFLSVLFLLTSLFCTFACAEDIADEYETQNWNIMLVLDGTNSMSGKSDKTGLRFEAIDSFIDTLWNKGDYVGAIVFTATLDNDSSEEAMYKGIKLDTWAKGAVPLEDNKTNLKKQINSTDKTLNTVNHQDTDIGTALLLAEEELEKACNENGLPGIIFVLTDGETDMNHSKTLNQSLANLQTAVTRMRDNGHVLFGGYYNSGEEQSQELRDAVKQAKNLSGGDLVLGKYYFEINEAQEIFNVFDRFLEVLGFSMPGNEIITESCEKVFNIPGTGVEELNIRFRTPNGQGLDKLSVSIVNPSGKELSADEMNAIYSTGDTYRMFKIHEPKAGKWVVKVELPRDDENEIIFDRIFNSFIEAAIRTNPSDDMLHSNITAEIRGYLSKRGEIITDADSYAGYSCQLVITDVYEETAPRIYDIEADKNGEFIFNLPLDFYGMYEAKIAFTCNEFRAESAGQTWDLTNRIPECSDVPEVNLTYSILSNEPYSIDLTEYLNDLEDGKNLKVSLASTSCSEAGILLDGMTLTLDPYRLGIETGEIQIKVEDSQGAFGIITIPVNVTKDGVKAVLQATPASDELHSNMTAGIKCFFSNQDEAITDPSAYAGYTCQLVLTNMNDATDVRTYDIASDKNGEFIFSLPLDFYGEYSAKAVFDNGEFIEESAGQTWNLTNRIPKCEDVPDVALNCALLSNDPLTIDMTDYMSDVEDGKNLAVSIESTTCAEDGLKMNGSKITFDPFKLGIGKGEVKVRIEDSQGAFKLVSIPVSVSMERLETYAQSEAFTILDRILKKQTVDIDIVGLISDAENAAERLNITMGDVTCNPDALSFNEGKLSFDKTSAGNGDVQFNIVDDKGVEDTLTVSISCKDRTKFYAIIIAAALLVIAIATLIIIKIRNGYYPKGTCTLAFSFMDDNDKEATLNVNLAPPGQGTRRKTNLYMMLSEDMNRQAGSLRSACEEEDIDFDSVERFISGISGDLRKTNISCVVGRQKDVGKVGKVKVEEGKRKQVLYNSSVNILPGGHSMTFGYFLNDSSAAYDDYYSSESDDMDYSDSYSSDDDY